MTEKGEKKICRRLTELSVGDLGKIDSLECKGALRRRLLDMGFVRGATVEKLGESPCGDPSAYLVRGAVVAVRHRDGEKILLEKMMGEGKLLWD